MSALFSFLYIYDPWFFHFFRMGFLVGASILIWLACKIYKKQLNNDIVVPMDSIFVIVALILLSIIPLLINSSTEFSVVIMYVKVLILFVLGVGIYNLFYQTPKGQQQFVQDLKFGVAAQAIFGFLALCDISLFIDATLSSHIVLPRFYGSEQEYRLYNITSSAFFQLSIFYVMLFHFLLAYNEKKNDISSVYIFLILFVGLVSGRTFFMFSILSILLYFKMRYIPALILFAVIVIFLAKVYPTHPYVEHALEPVINLLNGADRLSSSTDTLVNKHLFMPEIKQLIMGDGRYFTHDHHYYGGSDSGFIRQVLYGGVVYCLACLLFTWYFVHKISVNWFNNSWKFTYSSLLLLSILNIKADTYAFPGIMMVLLMFLSLFGSEGKNIVLFRKTEMKYV